MKSALFVCRMLAINTFSSRFSGVKRIEAGSSSEIIRTGRCHCGGTR